MACLVAVALLTGCASAAPPVVELRVPDEGRIPQLTVDASGTLHLMYLRGAITGGDLYYVRREAGASDWSPPVRVNSEPRSVIGMGPMDGGDLAVVPSEDGPPTLHAVWFLTDPLRFYHARRLPGEEGFSPQHVIWDLGDGVVEARPTIAGSATGDLFVAWHAGTEADTDDAHRAVHLMTSDDGGTTFSPPVVVSPTDEGACGCCSPEALADGDRLWIAYRGAGENVRRGMRLLVSRDGGAHFEDELLDPWELGACPVTTTTFARGPETTRIAWETDGQVFFAPLDEPTRRVSPGGVRRFRRKNPSIATNGSDLTILAWGDAPGYRAGGTLHWQIYDGDGREVGPAGGGTETIASGSGPATAALPDGRFAVVY